MNGNRILLDTNPVIYLLDGNEEVALHLQGKECWISVITELELFGKKGLTNIEIEIIESFIDDCLVADLMVGIKKTTKQLIQKYRLRLPDAIVAATALYLDLPLLTADTGFVQITELELILFKPSNL
jgi:predicted nucleic acid-binding protein